jgi:hypothetical protein
MHFPPPFEVSLAEIARSLKRLRQPRRNGVRQENQSVSENSTNNGSDEFSREEAHTRPQRIDD